MGNNLRNFYLLQLVVCDL